VNTGAERKEGKCHLKNLDADGRIKLGWVLKGYDIRT
jgi:hypothetical protein